MFMTAGAHFSRITSRKTFVIFPLIFCFSVFPFAVLLVSEKCVHFCA